jgi:prophage regulatory protein
MTRLAKSTILRMITKNDFPAPVRLATRIIAWRRSDLERWSEQRPTVTH